ncbi:MFS transporter [Chitinasiproducens palmae]|uniref:Predicted arabinose efflux permease, MFS family n=1 Tax=Chitinasiproducens palmae TaxID=1770053 RepID=A0A1H2PSE3_9BURK|nr:MFS transporter [Chitinasiproducens palmae]SDV49887.1 Predicted arabinose efflux permease, MFS family [Chitinasiproducens palmae]
MSASSPVQSRRPVDLQILPVVFFTFVCYLAVGLPIAVLPAWIIDSLGYSPFVAGTIMSAQYVATLLSRPVTGRVIDLRGPKHATLSGLIACVASAATYAVAFACPLPGLALALLVAARLLLGVGESMVATGAITWGIGVVGASNTAKVISWNGIATYSALAVAAPLGVAIAGGHGFVALALLSGGVAVIATFVAFRKAPVAVATGERLPYHRVIGQVAPHGLVLALGSAGFGVLATFVTLFFASRNWTGAATSLSVFGICFISVRLLFAHTVRRHGGLRVALVSMALEALGLLLLTAAPSPFIALLASGLAGSGFSLVFPALGVEAVKHVPPASRGSAIGAYSAFLDLSLALTSPLAGLLARRLGYGSIFVATGIGCVLGAMLVTILLRREHRAARRGVV